MRLKTVSRGSCFADAVTEAPAESWTFPLVIQEITAVHFQKYASGKEMDECVEKGANIKVTELWLSANKTTAGPHLPSAW